MSRLAAIEFPRIYLRDDQLISQIKCDHDHNGDHYNEVKIFAPKWVDNCINNFREVIPKNTVFKVIDRNEESIDLKIENELTLKHLIMIARNESSNVSGIINTELYKPLISDEKIIYSMKDLVRQSIIIGREQTTHYGGYGGSRITQQKEVILIDLIGLQFQQKYNTGRLVLISEDPVEGILDNVIFENIVGQNKKSFLEVRDNMSDRYVKHKDCYFDTYAYEMFVAHDFLMVCLALNTMDITEVNLKFLKYGTGFFAGPYSPILNSHISEGVYKGLKQFLVCGKNQKIKSFEFPFYDKNNEIINLCQKYSIECRFSREDALKQTHPTLMTATTNCADPHAVTGNEMGYSSVDAAIAQNLKSKANDFSPVLNNNMSQQFIDLPLIKSKF